MLGKEHIKQLREAIAIARNQEIEKVRLVLDLGQATELADFSEMRNEEANNDALEASGY